MREYKNGVCREIEQEKVVIKETDESHGEKDIADKKYVNDLIAELRAEIEALKGNS